MSTADRTAFGKALVWGKGRAKLHDWRSLWHVWWECRNHVVIMPKYPKDVFMERHATGLVVCQD